MRTIHARAAIMPVWALATALAPCTKLQAQPVGTSEPLASLVGQYAQNPTGLYGTDLGWSFEHGDKLWMLFGDSWKSPTDTYLGDWFLDFIPAGDDAIGFIDLRAESFRDGDSVERFVRDNRSVGGFAWQVSKPLVQAVSPGGALPIAALRGGLELKTLGPGLTPLTGFSNGRSDATAGAFGIFFRNEPAQCRNGCGEFTCDSGLGRCVEQGQAAPTSVSSPCVVGETPAHSRCVECRAIRSSGGFCQDTRSSMYDRSPRGRASAVVVTQEVGCSTGSNDLNRVEPGRNFDTKPWNTHRFFNAMARTVNDFDPGRAAGSGNDYTTADGIDTAREGVFVWGRPHFGGSVEAGRDVQLYLAWVPMPSYGADGRFAWNPQYFAGLDAQGRPRFVTRETESVALGLSGPDDAGSSEILEVVGQMSISFLPGSNRWLMLYGGGLSDQFGGLIFGEDWQAVQGRETNAGPLYIRTAEQPWGPWTAPRPLVEPGNPNDASGLYAAGGLLYSAECRGSCVQSESAWNNPGGLYAPNIIEPWTEDRGSAVDLYWNMSTWNPYAVILMKTTLSDGDLQ